MLADYNEFFREGRPVIVYRNLIFVLNGELSSLYIALLRIADACFVSVKYQIKDAAALEASAVHAVLPLEVETLLVWHIQIYELGDRVQIISQTVFLLLVQIFVSLDCGVYFVRYVHEL